MTMTDEPGPEPPISPVHALRRRWKPIKVGPASAPEHDSIRIRMHRCMSWLARVEALAELGDASDDARLVHQWIALNALYGRWNPDRREPAGDRESMSDFTRRLHEQDEAGHVARMLTEHKRLIETLVGDPFLNRIYWVDLSESAARRAERATRHVREMYREKRYRAVLDETLDRVYLCRCQLVHGAASFDSGLNRKMVRNCARFMELLLPELLAVVMDGAWAVEDWSGLCYPPQE